jgi:hypothetical protein
VIVFEPHTYSPSDDHGQFCYARVKEAPDVVAFVVTMSKGYDLDWHIGFGAAERAGPIVPS